MESSQSRFGDFVDQWIRLSEAISLDFPGTDTTNRH